MAEDYELTYEQVKAQDLSIPMKEGWKILVKPDIGKWEYIIPETYTAPAYTYEPSYTPISEEEYTRLMSGYSLSPNEAVKVFGEGIAPPGASEILVRSNPTSESKLDWTIVYPDGSMVTDSRYFTPQGVELSEEDIRKARKLREAFARLIPDYDYEEAIAWAESNPEGFFKLIQYHGDTPDTRIILTGMGLSDEDIEWIFNPPGSLELTAKDLAKE